MRILRQLLAMGTPDPDMPRFVVQCSGHGSAFRFDAGPMGEDYPTQFLTLEQAVAEADRWIGHADTIGGQARVLDGSRRIVWDGVYARHPRSGVQGVV
jgi:hypothetical protein